MSSNVKWQNRIVRTAMVPPDQLLAHALNFRIHPKHQQDALQGSLDELGWYKRIVCQDQTDVVIDGHARVTLALRNNEPLVPVDYVDFTDEETNLALATGDPISALAEFDRAKFGELLEDTGTSGSLLRRASVTRACPSITTSCRRTSSRSASRNRDGSIRKPK